MLHPRPHEIKGALSSTAPTPITFGFPDAAVERIAAKLNDARLPGQSILPGVGWQYGTDTDKLRTLVEAWRDGNPAGSGARGATSGESTGRPGFVQWWRRMEAQINETAPHYLVEIEGLQIHFQMKKSESPDAIPLLFSHGWPGSFYEAHRLFPLLTGASTPSFHLIAPSLPGYGLSSPPTKPDWTLHDSARVLHKLMTSILGFNTYAVQGGDLGMLIARSMARNPECTAFHSNFCPPIVMPLLSYPGMAALFFGWENTWVGKMAMRLIGPNPHELRLLKAGCRYIKSGTAYLFEQSTKPATLGSALFDNPVGILGWHLQCFHEWSDPRAPAFHDGHSHSPTTDQVPGQQAIPDGVGQRGASHDRLGVSHATLPVNRESAITDETILVNTTIYALTDTAHTSFLPYYESLFMWVKLGKDREWNRALRNKPYGHSSFPYELSGCPPSWIPGSGVNLVFYRQHNEGGHFAALDNPEALARDLKDFFLEHYSTSVST
ncbi:hypothetical protein OC846_003612 [Tilletia horrida]|uniref:Epoxide hydrolase N-terminal domain-containing protein n=1 Tax=Tilletia horrida TaxID=155126 RepID=A0AAN6GNU6_9BASI|nr:hypothetical protein OC846_003612 [Tilletia horrida]KAK0565750.1 hypothetical protein OC861_003620 [Tilletia horrida]